MSANWKYRQYLTKNADAIITENQTFKCTEEPRYPKTTHTTNTPFLYSSCVDTAQPVGYENSNLKQMFLEKRQMMCTMVAPEIHIQK
jgi:hypothetical protein